MLWLRSSNSILAAQQSALDISELKLILNWWYLKVNHLAPENMRKQEVRCKKITTTFFNARLCWYIWAVLCENRAKRHMFKNSGNCIHWKVCAYLYVFWKCEMVSIIYHEVMGFRIIQVSKFLNMMRFTSCKNVLTSMS